VCIRYYYQETKNHLEQSILHINNLLKNELLIKKNKLFKFVHMGD
jgi:hypothetical protein